jgi:hypothetical protein
MRSANVCFRGQVAFEHERDLRFDLRLDQRRKRHRLAVAVRHRREQRTEVRLIDAELLLHRRRSQADLPADDTLAVGLAQVVVDLLDRIGERRVASRTRIAQRCDRPARRLCFTQARGHRSNAVVIRHGSLSWKGSARACIAPKPAIHSGIAR